MTILQIFCDSVIQYFKRKKKFCGFIGPLEYKRNIPKIIEKYHFEELHKIASLESLSELSLYNKLKLSNPYIFAT